MKTKLKILWVLLGVLVFVFLVSFSVIQSKNRPISDFNIQIDHPNDEMFLNNSLVESILESKGNKVIGIPMSGINVTALESRLNQYPFVKLSNVYQSANGVLNVNIEQEVPFVRVRNSSDEYYITDTFKKTPLSTYYAANVMMVEGHVVEEDYKALKNIIYFINEDNLLKKQIIGMVKVAPNSFNLVVNHGDYLIEFGSLEGFANKFKKLKLFYNQYLGKVGDNYYTKINLKYKNQIVATKRESEVTP